MNTSDFKTLFDPAKPPESLLAEKFYVIDGIKFSVLQSEEHNRKGQLTKHPMERGVQVSDHFIQEPEIINVRCEQTNVLYSGYNPFEGFTTQQLLDSVNSITNWAEDYCKKVWSDLNAKYQARKPFTLITFHETYEDVIITSISGMHRAPYKGALQFNVTFQKVHFVDIQTVAKVDARNETQAERLDRGTQKAMSFDSLSEVPA